VRGELVTREYLDLALGKLKAEVERDIGTLRLGTERLLREQTDKLVIWMNAIVGLAVTTVGGLGVLF